MKIALKSLAGVVLCLGLFGTNPIVEGQGTTQIIAEPGLIVPGAANPVAEVRYPAINDSGKILFAFSTDVSNQRLVAEWDAGQYDLLLDDGELGVVGSVFPVGYAEDHALVWVQDVPFDFHTFVFDGNSQTWTSYFAPGTPDPSGNGEVNLPWIPACSKNGHWISFQELANTQNGGLDDGTLNIVNGSGLPTQVAREGEQAPNGGDYLYLLLTGGVALPEDYTLNRNGQAAFPAALTPANLEAGIFFWDGQQVVEIFRSGDPTPSGDTFSLPATGNGPTFASRTEINDFGHAAVYSNIASPGNDNYFAIFDWDGSSFDEKFRLPVQMGSQTMDQLVSSVRFNNAGHMTFAVSNGPEQSLGLIQQRDQETRFLFEPDELVEPDLQFRYVDSFGQTYNAWEPACLMNEHSVVCSKVALLPLAGAPLQFGIYLSDGIDRIKVNLEGDDAGNGLTWAEPTLNYFFLQGGRFLNDFGQVVYVAETVENAVSTIRLFTPDLHWRGSNSGNWDEKSDWTLGLPPARVHKVRIDPTTATTVTGPATSTTVKELCIGGDPVARAELQLQENVTLTAVDGVSVLQGGVLSGTGTVAGNVNSSGELSPGLSPGEITISGNLTQNGNAVTSIEVEGVQPAQYDRLIVQGDVQLDGSLNVVFSTRSFLAAGQQFLIGDFAGTVTGQFANAPERTVVHSQGILQVEVSYMLGDGNDFGLVVSSVDAAQPFGRKLLDGLEVGGTIGDTDDSDDVYYRLDPSPTNNPVKQIVEMILLAESPVSNPSSFSFRLEAAMSGGPVGDVIQSIELWNETDQQWEVLDTRAATNADSTVHVTPTGDLTRFIHPLTDEIIAKVKWVSSEFSGSPFDWSIDIDQLGWLIGS